MNDLIIYIFKSAIWITIFWGIYRFFFRNETFFRFNRNFLLTGIIASFVLPLFQIRYPVELVTFSPVNMIETAPSTINDTIFIHFDWIRFLLLFYIIGALILFLYYGFELYKIRRLIRKRNICFGEKSNVIYTSVDKSPFSFFGYVFMNPETKLQDIEKELILVHETAHVEQHHWVDILLIQLVCVFQWFNPFAWLYLKAVKQNHEFLADNSVVETGYSPAVYQAVLINCTFNVPVFTFTNSFAYINKFKRIAIMKKNISKPVKKLAVLLLLPAFAVFLAAFAKPEYHYSVLPSQSETETVVLQDSMKVTQPTQKTPTREAPPPPTQKETSRENPPLKKTVQLTPPKVKKDEPSEIIQVSGQVLDTDGKTDTLKNRTEDPEKVVVIGYGTRKKNEPNEPKEPENDLVQHKVFIKSEIEIQTDSLNKANSPLIIVDGQEYTSSINTLKPDNIESISILKDASATATYGEKGKKGVILITTKNATP